MGYMATKMITSKQFFRFQLAIALGSSTLNLKATTAMSQRNSAILKTLKDSSIQSNSSIQVFQSLRVYPEGSRSANLFFLTKTLPATMSGPNIPLRGVKR